MKRNRFNEIIFEGFEELGLQFRKNLTDQLYIYMDFLIHENSKYNLTAINEEKEIIDKHFLDALVFFTKYNLKEGTKVVDIGTGAGFPGLVFKLYRPDLEVLLVDSLNKRINFLNTLIRKFDISRVEALHARAEEIGNNSLYREKYDLAVSRAVAPINILSEYTIPFVIKGGSIVYFKGPDYELEIKEGLNAIEILGGKLEGIHQVNIPNIKVERFLVELKKAETTPARYPRRPGIPKKRPL